MNVSDKIESIIKMNQVEELNAYLDEHPGMLNENIKFGPYGMMLTLLQKSAQLKKPDIMKLLLEKGADPNYKGRDLIPPIFYAIEDESCFFLLLEYGASLQSTNSFGQTLRSAMVDYKVSDRIREAIEKNGSSPKPDSKQRKLIAPPAGYNYIIINDTHIGPSVDNTILRMDRDLKTLTKIFGDLSECIATINPNYITINFYDTEHCILMIADEANTIKGMVIFKYDNTQLKTQFTIFVLCGSNASRDAPRAAETPRIGTHLTAAVNNLGRLMNVETIALKSVTPALGFYVKQGFICSGDGCEMEKNVNGGGHKRRKTRRRKTRTSRKRGINKK